MRGAEEDLGLGTGHGLHAEVPAEEDRRVLTAGPPPSRPGQARPGQARPERPLGSRT